MSESNEFEEWIEHAEDDYENAKIVIRRRKPSVYGSCFHAQQCAEKYMKALLVFKGRSFPMTHDLLIINNRIRDLRVIQYSNYSIGFIKKEFILR